MMYGLYYCNDGTAKTVANLPMFIENFIYVIIGITHSIAMMRKKINVLK